MPTYTYTADTDVERGKHAVSTQVNNIWAIVTSNQQDVVAAYDLTTHGIDLYQGDVRIVARGIQLQDAILPDLPQLSFTADTLLAGDITCVVRDRGLYVYRFAVRYVDKASDGSYGYQCEAAERGELSAQKSILAKATSSADLVHLAAPSLRIVNEGLLTQVVTEQAFDNSAPIDIIDQLLTINGCIGHVRNWQLYLLPLDLSGQTALSAISRNDARVGWSRDTIVYDKVRVWYTLKQSPLPSSALTNYDAANWTGTLANEQTVATSLLAAPSGAAYMLKATGNSSRAGLAITLAGFDRFLVNWCPVTASTMTVSLQDDASNKVEFTRTFGGGQGAGFIASGVSPDDTATKTIACGGNKHIVQLLGTVTQPCSYRATTKRGATVVWQSEWFNTSGLELRVDIPASTDDADLCDTIYLEFKGLYVVGAGYGVQVNQLTISEYLERAVATGQHTRLVSTQSYSGNMSKTNDSTATMWYFKGTLGAAPALGSGQSYSISVGNVMAFIYRWASPTELEITEETIPVNVYVANGQVIAEAQQAINDTYVYKGIASASLGTVRATLLVYETITDSALVWSVLPWAWSASYNLWDMIDIPISQMVKTGSPKTIKTIAITCAGDYYLDTAYFVANNPTPVKVEVGYGSRVYEVRTGEFGSSAAALAYARGLLSVVSVAKEEYGKQISLGTGLAVGDIVDADGTNMVVSKASYSGNDNTVQLSVGRQVGSTLEALKLTARRLDALEKNIL